MLWPIENGNSRMGRAWWGLVCSSALAFALACGDGPAAPEPETSPPAPVSPPDSGPPLILFISLDTLRADHLGFYGYERPTSPVLDALAEQSVVFEDASATSPWTLPSHASMMTGLYPLRHGVVASDTRMPGRFDTLSEQLGRSGYETFAVVNTPWLQRDLFGFMRGFEHTLFVKGGGDRVAPNNMVTDQVLHWVEQGGEKPKFIFVHYIDIHSDYVSLPEHEAQFVRPYTGAIKGTTNQLYQLRVSDEFLAACRASFDPVRCVDHAGEPLGDTIRKSALDPAGLRHLVDRYDAGIHQLDAELGRLFSALEQGGWMDRILLVVTADHGEELMDHGSVFHAGTMYQEVLRVPLIIHGPDLPRGVRIKAPVSLTDLAPTLLAMARAKPLLEVDGRDLSALLRGEDEQAFVERDLFGEAPGEVNEMVGETNYRSLRRGRYKLHYEVSRGSYELYDLDSDPREANDIAALEPELFAAMRLRLDRRHGITSTEAADSVELKDEDREALRALGYLE